MATLNGIVTKFERMLPKDVYKLVGSHINNLILQQDSELLNEISIVSNPIKKIVQELSCVHATQVLDMIVHSSTENLIRFLMSDFGIKTYTKIKDSVLFLNKLLVNHSESNEILNEIFKLNHIEGKTDKDLEKFRHNFRLFIKSVVGSLSVSIGKKLHRNKNELQDVKLTIDTLEYLKKIREHANTLPMVNQFANKCPITRKERYFVTPLASLTNEQLLHLINKNGQLQEGTLNRFLKPPYVSFSPILFLFEKVQDAKQRKHLLPKIKLCHGNF